MSVQIWVGIIIAGLLVYIIFLQIQLTKRNVFIESTVKKLSGIEKSRSMDEMMIFLHEIQKLDQYSVFFSDKFLSGSTIDFILENEKELRIYIHYTKEEKDAKNILQNGFKFAESFYKTALPVSKDELDLVIKHNSRKFYGEFLIIICISNDIVNFYSMELEKAGIKNHYFENILTEKPPSRNDNSDLEYQLPFQFIKGFINYRTGEIFKNPGFDPWYNSPAFMKNIDFLKRD
jgi:hypothetical protein